MGQHIKRVFQYDNLNRLVSVTEAGQESHYAYDFAGNRISVPPGESTVTVTAAKGPQALELERQYVLLKSQLDAGQISAKEFEARVNRELRFEDSRGRWRQIRALDGKWLEWNGEKWVEHQREG
jgi:YD repeat-containing protein